MTGLGKSTEVTEDRQSHIMGQVDSQKSNLNRLESNWDELYSRIIPLLRDQDAEKDAEKATLAQPLAPLAEDLRNSNDRIRRVVQHIEETVERLEL